MTGNTITKPTLWEQELQNLQWRVCEEYACLQTALDSFANHLPATIEGLKDKIKNLPNDIDPGYEEYLHEEHDFLYGSQSYFFQGMHVAATAIFESALLDVSEIIKRRIDGKLTIHDISASEKDKHEIGFVQKFRKYCEKYAKINFQHEKVEIPDKPEKVYDPEGPNSSVSDFRETLRWSAARFAADENELSFFQPRTKEIDFKCLEKLYDLRNKVAHGNGELDKNQVKSYRNHFDVTNDRDLFSENPHKKFFVDKNVVDFSIYKYELEIKIIFAFIERWASPTPVPLPKRTTK
jgi:hypothetical protein